MSRYSKVARRIWNDGGFRRLSSAQPNGQTLFLRLLTGPELTNVPGLFPAWDTGLAKALRWDIEAFRGAFAEACAEGMVEADWDSGIVWVPKAVEYNRPESPNVVRSWRTNLSELPECALKNRACGQLRAFLKGMGEGFGRAFAEALGEALGEASASRDTAHALPPSPNQEQEQEQEQEQDPPNPTTAHDAPVSTGALPKSEKLLWGHAWIGEYEKAARVALDREWSFDRRQLNVLEQVVGSFCKNKRDIQGWIGAAVQLFVKATRSDEANLWSSHQPRGMLRWFNEGRPERGRPNPTATQKPPYHKITNASAERAQQLEEQRRSFAERKGDA